MLKDISIGKRLVFAFMFVIIISCIAGVVGILQILKIDSDYSYALKYYGFAQGDVGLLGTEFNDNRTIIRDFIFSADIDAMNSYSEKYSRSNTQIESCLLKVKKSMVSANELKYYKQISKDMTQYKEIGVQAVELAMHNNNSKAQEVMTQQANPLSEKIANSITALIQENVSEGNAVSENLSQQSRTTVISILAVLLFSILICIFIALKIARGISRPVQDLTKAARKLAAGELDISIASDSRKDEIGQLNSAFSETIAILKAYITDIKSNLNRIAHGNLCVSLHETFRGDFVELKDAIDHISVTLKDAFAQIDRSAEQVTNGAEQISAGSQVLAHGSAEQANSVKQLSETVSEISGHVKGNATNAEAANNYVNDVCSEIQISSTCMDHMMNAISGISDSSNEIVKIEKVIENIAFQTQILSLNASVEAARAGGAGKGFAVVAEEVRNLAQKSTKAAGEVTISIRNSMVHVKDGIETAEKTAKSLRRVTENMNTVSDMVGKISSVSLQQAKEIKQIDEGFHQISDVVQTNSATAEEGAAQSEELSGQARLMKDLVGKFQLR